MLDMTSMTGFSLTICSLVLRLERFSSETEATRVSSQFRPCGCDAHLRLISDLLVPMWLQHAETVQVVEMFYVVRSSALASD